MIKHLIKYKWWHLVAWCILTIIVLIIPNFALVYFSENLGTLKHPLLSSLPFSIILFYGNHYLLDKLVFSAKRKIPAFALYLSLLIILVIILKTIADNFWVNYYYDILKEKAGLTNTKEILGNLFLLNTLTSVIILFLSFAIGFIVQYSISKKNNQQLTEAKLQAEIAFLKMQINPHLLFNTLNHFYALALKDKNKGLAQGIIQLSDMMRYMLYETNVESIPLDKEISYIQSYLDLYAMRLHSDTSEWIDFKAEGRFNQFKIAPMLLISFVENALKHGKRGDVKDKIKIHLQVKNHQLLFSTQNQIDFTNGVDKDTAGVGLDNVNKRLALIYPEAYDLNINKNDSFFSVKLKLDSL